MMPSEKENCLLSPSSIISHSPDQIPKCKSEMLMHSEPIMKHEQSATAACVGIRTASQRGRPSRRAWRPMRRSSPKRRRLQRPGQRGWNWRVSSTRERQLICRIFSRRSGRRSRCCTTGLNYNYHSFPAHETSRLSSVIC